MGHCWSKNLSEKSFHLKFFKLCSTEVAVLKVSFWDVWILEIRYNLNFENSLKHEFLKFLNYKNKSKLNSKTLFYKKYSIRLRLIHVIQLVTQANNFLFHILLFILFAADSCKMNLLYCLHISLHFNFHCFQVNISILCSVLKWNFQ